MQLHLTLYRARRVVAGQSKVDLSFETPSVTLAQVIEALTAAYPRLRPYLQDASGGLHPSLRILLNNERADPDVTLATALHADCFVTGRSSRVGAHANARRVDHRQKHLFTTLVLLCAVIS